MSRVRQTVLVRPASDCKSDINVTPLVDVVLVLLIIFMVVMPLLEHDFTLRVPVQEQVESASQLPPEQIAVRVAASGELTINGEPLAGDAYVSELQKRLAPRSADQRIVFVSSDGDAPYHKLVQALEGAKTAGASTLAMTDAL
jgi:biopolymer transport protein ExbD